MLKIGFLAAFLEGKAKVDILSEATAQFGTEVSIVSSGFEVETGTGDRLTQAVYLEAILWLDAEPKYFIWPASSIFVEASIEYEGIDLCSYITGMHKMKFVFSPWVEDIKLRSYEGIIYVRFYEGTKGIEANRIGGIDHDLW